MQSETIVISVGGSLIVPNDIDHEFLKQFKSFIESQVQQGKKFIIITGGGKISRKYTEAAAAISNPAKDDLDWLGIHTTRLNAHLLRTIFRDIAHPVVVKNPHEDIQTDKPLIVAAGWRPGNSTDYIATLFAKQLGAHKLINLSNIDYVYTDDPKKNPEAEKIEKISWDEFRKLIPSEWDPGLSSPFDPVAAREAQKQQLEIAIINGSRLDELAKYIKGEKFVGTLIS